MLLDAQNFHKDEDGCYVAEISELRLTNIPMWITLKNCPKEGQSRNFKREGVDESGGDVAGWRYVEEDSPNCGRCWEDGHPPKSVPIKRVLIIND